jgi:hypothetical protein
MTPSTAIVLDFRKPLSKVTFTSSDPVTIDIANAVEGQRVLFYLYADASLLIPVPISFIPSNIYGEFNNLEEIYPDEEYVFEILYVDGKFVTLAHY